MCFIVQQRIWWEGWVSYCQQPTKTVNLSAFSVLLLNGKVIIAAVIQFLVLGRGDLDLVGCAVNKG